MRLLQSAHLRWLSFTTCCLLAVAACSQASLEDAYKRLYLSMFALEFPSSKEAFDGCVRNQVQPCLDLVERARQGKHALQAVEPRKALEHTLETITATCPHEQPDQQEICLGAIVSLYFFREPEQDALILLAVLRAERVTQQKFLGPAPFAWHGNRPIPERWIEALDKLPPDAFPRTGKDSVLKGFSSPAGPYDDGGVRLL